MSRSRSQSEGKEAFEKLSQSEDQLRRIIDTIPTLAWSARPDGSAEFFNRRWLDFTGLTIQEALEWGWKDAIHPDDLSRMLETFHEALKVGRSFEAEGRLRHNGGGFRWFLFRASPLCDESGLVVKWYGTNTDIEDLKLAEEALRWSEERWRAVFENSAIGVALTDLSGRFLFTNSAYQKMLGYTEEEIRKLTFLELTHEDYRESNWEFVTELFEGKRKQFQIEKKYRRKDGSLIWVSNNVSLVPGTERVPRFIMALSEDITERKRALEKLEAKQELLDLAQKAARAIAFDWHIQESVNTWSPEQEALYGLAPGTFDGTYQSWKKLVHPKDWPLIVTALSQAQDTGDISAEFRVVWPDGSTHWLAAKGQMFFDEQGQPFRMVGFTADVTSRKLAEEELRRSEWNLLEAQRLGHSGSWALDIASGIVTSSPEMIRQSDPQPGEDYLKPDFWFSRIHADDRHRVRELFERCIIEKTDYQADYRIVRPDGTVKYHHSIGYPIMNQAGELVEFVGTAIEMTEQVQARIALEEALTEIKLLKDQLFKENLALRDEVDRVSMFEEIVGTSRPLRTVLSQVIKVAPNDSTVLITGETGTGKELFARAIHKRSQRSQQAFVSVNCAALAPSLISSELFGHEKGAFTGAVQRRIGRFESANGGTIFLDEVGELTAETQVALLRVLQEREFERLGGNQPISVDVRVVAATNRHLEAAVGASTFREDLFYRLNVFPIHIPPLRERVDDIPLLVEYFIGRYAKKAGKKFKTITKKTLDLFRAYNWPGNIRELQNVVERAVIVSDDEIFSVDEKWLKRDSSRESQGPGKSGGSLSRDAERERALIEAALAESRGQIAGASGAARKLGIPRQTLDSKIRGLGIDKLQFRRR
jgi:PAS domain S-box-containing protein